MAPTTTAAVASAKGIDFDAVAAVERNRAALEGARDHLPSMLVDVLAGRRTEIDAMCGAVVAEGRRLGVPVPVNEVVTELVRAIAATPRYRQLGSILAGNRWSVMKALTWHGDMSFGPTRGRRGGSGGR